MRIDFNATFKQVSKLMEASGKPNAAPEASSEFSDTLSGVVGQTPGSIKDSGQSVAQSNSLSEDIMASLHFTPPQSKAPPLSQFEGQILIPEEVKEASQSVKTPSVLEAKRIEVAPNAKFAERMAKVEKLVTQFGKEAGVDPALGMAVARVESSFNPKAVSTDGHASKGLFQLLDQTGKELHLQSGIEDGYDPFNPDQNVTLGLRYLRRLHDTFSQDTKLPNDLQSVSAANSSSLEKLAVAAFNAGEGRVASAQARARAAGFNPGMYDQVQSYLPKSTQEYVNRVMQFKSEFGRDDIG